MPKKVVVYVVNPDGTNYRKEINYNLSDMQDIVGGHIELVGCHDKPYDCFCNEDGIALELDHNPVATYMLRSILGYDGINLLGSVYFIGEPNYEGDSTSLSDESVLELASLARRAAFLHS